jgi:hypothetical protein
MSVESNNKQIEANIKYIESNYTNWFVNQCQEKYDETAGLIASNEKKLKKFNKMLTDDFETDSDKSIKELVNEIMTGLNKLEKDTSMDLKSKVYLFTEMKAKVELFNNKIKSQVVKKEIKN